MTEMTFGVDIVEIMIKLALNIPFHLNEIKAKQQIGHAIEVRVYAENPLRSFYPSSGRISHVQLPTSLENVRVDTWIHSEMTITPYYDPLLAKIIAFGSNRD